MADPSGIHQARVRAWAPGTPGEVSKHGRVGRYQSLIRTTVYPANSAMKQKTIVNQANQDRPYVDTLGSIFYATIRIVISGLPGTVIASLRLGVDNRAACPPSFRFLPPLVLLYTKPSLHPRLVLSFPSIESHHVRSPDFPLCAAPEAGKPRVGSSIVRGKEKENSLTNRLVITEFPQVLY